jgi:hypothetical protein
MPDLGAYAVAVLVLNGLGAPSLAAMLQRRLASVACISYGHVYLAVLLAVCVWGAFCFNFRLLIGANYGLIASLPIGLVAGHLAFTADRAILRRARSVGSAGAKHSHSRLQSADVTFDSGFTLWSLLFVAVLEEIVFRDWYIEACRLIPLAGLRWAALIGSVLAFALLHLKFGWCDVIAKLPLGALALLAVLLTGSLLAPGAAHLYFNWRYWRLINLR